MEFLEAMPVTFKEITPNYSLPEKWKEIILNTGIYFIFTLSSTFVPTIYRNCTIKLTCHHNK